MNRYKALAFSVLGAVALLSPVSKVLAQAIPDVPQPSPKARVEQHVGLTDFSVDYSSPAVRGRKIWGTLVPYDKVWRTGANAATKLTASRDFTVGDKTLPAGAYAIYTIPGKSAWVVTLNTAANASGAFAYDEKNDLVRLTIKPAHIDSRERLAVLFADTTDDSTRLDIEWEQLRISIPIKVDSKSQTIASIDKTLSDAWRPHFVAARWLYDSGGNLDQALTYIDQSIGIKSTWWNHWVRAQILGKKGRSSEASAAAEKAQMLGKGDSVFDFFKDDVAKSLNDWKKNS